MSRSNKVKERYNRLENKLSGLFNNCGTIWDSYKDKHEELKEVYGFLKLLADNLKDMSLNIKQGDNCDDVIDSILAQLASVINDREVQDKEEQKSLIKLKDEQKIIMDKFRNIKKNLKYKDVAPPKGTKLPPKGTKLPPKDETPEEINILLKKRMAERDRLLAIFKQKKKRLEEIRRKQNVQKTELSRMQKLSLQRERIRHAVKEQKRREAQKQLDVIRKMKTQLHEREQAMKRQGRTRQEPKSHNRW